MLHRVNPHAVHAVLADDVVVVVSEGWVGGQHGGWHMGWEAHTVERVARPGEAVTHPMAHIS